MNITKGFTQELNVVYIQGEVKTHLIGESIKTAKNLLYGPIKWNQVVILGPNSSLKILRQNGELCELTTKGSFEVSSLKFVQPAESSIFGRFKDYFQAFFGAQNNPENKDQHKNIIFAGTRGDGLSPYLISPSPGKVSLDFGSLEFSWISTCDTCTYNFKIYDVSNKKEIYKLRTKSCNVILLNATKYLLPEKKYYWLLESSSLTNEPNKNMFTVASKGEANNIIQKFKRELGNNKISLTSTTAYLLIHAFLIESGQLNFAAQYALKVKNENRNNTFLATKLDAANWEEQKKLIQSN